MISSIIYRFDKCLFELFKKHLSFKKDHQKHGLHHSLSHMQNIKITYVTF